MQQSTSVDSQQYSNRHTLILLLYAMHVHNATGTWMQEHHQETWPLELGKQTVQGGKLGFAGIRKYNRAGNSGITDLE